MLKKYASMRKENFFLNTITLKLTKEKFQQIYYDICAINNFFLQVNPIFKNLLYLNLF